jgi:hypothetical protein
MYNKVYLNRDQKSVNGLLGGLGQGRVSPKPTLAKFEEIMRNKNWASQNWDKEKFTYRQ